ncbi:MAG TPA: dienelactone hydrolase [Erythrobacter sp.]|nr:dienelactone hydrolase [Erythrobacter sp.]
MTMEEINYSDGELPLKGMLARPGGSPRATVAVFPTIHNITPRVAEKAKLLAKEGYAALVMDFYGEEVTEANPGPPLSEKLRAENSVFRHRLHSGLKALRKLEPDLPMLAIGFCMGGRAVLELARDGADLVAVASFHGLLDTEFPAAAGAINARILVCQGDKDPLVPREQVFKFMEEMDEAEADWHLHIYSAAKHGFTDPANDAKNIDAVGYDASADQQSWDAMLHFFNESLSAA